MEKQYNFYDLSAHLRLLLEAESYSKSTVRDMEFILSAFADFMSANDLESYTPEIGDRLIRYCEEDLHVCASRVTRANVIVRKLNRLYQGLDGRAALWGERTSPMNIPDGLSDSLNAYITHCHKNGNIRILYGCGTRLGETMALQRKDVDFRAGTIFLRKTKFSKERLIPAHESLMEILEQYCLALGIMDKPDAYLFPGRKSEHHFTSRQMDTWFSEILRLANIDQRNKHKNERSACIHCFRHLFVLKSMQQLESVGHPVDLNDLLLPTYLGHECLIDTDKYMRFSGVQVPESLDAFEAFTDGLIPFVEVPYAEE